MAARLSRALTRAPLNLLLAFIALMWLVPTLGLFFTSLQYIGLAEATAIMDLNPVLITLGGALFLGEKVGPRRLRPPMPVASIVPRMF